MKSKVIIFFGVPGSGKSYLGRMYSDLKNFDFYEADEDWTLSMRKEIEKNPANKPSVMQDFLKIMGQRIKDRIVNGRVLVVASALGKNWYRSELVELLGDEVDIQWVWISPEDKDLHLEKITERESSDSSLEKYELRQDLAEHIDKKNADFEKPDFEYIEIKNDYSERVLGELNEKIS